ncbi:MAG: hypothetical protein AVDCRST_MAG89-1034, partial [uncultured Gemmatimonadetes bacterium]
GDRKSSPRASASRRWGATRRGRAD